MKIGILTLPFNTNYGGLLQAYALQTTLQRMGHEVFVLDQSPYVHISFLKKILVYTKRSILKYIMKRDVRIFQEEHYNQTYSIISQFTQMFIKKYIHRFEVNDLTKLQEKDFDMIVVGSDQIWRPSYYRGNITNAYLAFAKQWKIKRIAYAPSFGTDDWEYSFWQTKRCKYLISKFDVVSVREESGIKLCRDYFGIEVQHALDPTMLLEKNDYEALVKTAGIANSDGELLVYVLDMDDSKQNMVDNISKQEGIKPFFVNAKIKDEKALIEDRIQKPVELWLRGFMDAKFVITDSFHACVFSIIFNKPFIVVGNKKRGLTRFDSLLRMFKLESRLVLSLDEALEKVHENIHWEEINNICHKRKNDSKVILEKAVTSFLNSYVK